jgi:endonuclease/exonuclease/phosphatase family metal-dependent hydrolase
MIRILIFTIIVSLISCKTGSVQNKKDNHNHRKETTNHNEHSEPKHDAKEPEEELPIENYRFCFWNVKNLSKAGLERETKGPFIIQFIQKYCDVVALLEVRSAKIDMASVLEEALDDKYECEEGEPKGEGSRTEKYLLCIKTQQSIQISMEEYKDTESIFSRPPTIFSFIYKKKELVIVPFHSRPKDKEELRSFDSVVEYTQKKYFKKIVIYGGDFNTGSNYQSETFLNSLVFFTNMAQLITSPTTFGKQKHDLIFVDKKYEKNCKGHVWNLEELFEEVEGRKELEKISDHFPVSAECNF